MKTLSIDIETYSSHDLKKTGVYRYVEAPDFAVLLFAYSVDRKPVQIVDLACGEKIPDEIIAALTDDTVLKWAFHASFERVCLSRHLGYPTGSYLNPVSWRCSMVWAATLGLPLSLENVGSVLELDKQKLTEGKDLIRYFCQPCTPTKANGQRTRNLPYHAPDKWDAFRKYNIRDVETEMAIQEKLSKFPVPDFVWEEYRIDQEINDRGVGLDMELVRAAIELDAYSHAELTENLKALTGLENPNSVVQMKAWLADQGMETDTLGKKTVSELIKNASPALRDVLDTLAMLYDDIPDTLSQLIRTAFVPQNGRKFIVSDFSAIEARVIAWLAGEEWRQKVFADGGDIYCASASQRFKVPVEPHGINGHLRQKGKVAELALGYGGSVNALKAMGALEKGLTEEELPLIVDAWRQASPNITKLWWNVDTAAKDAVRFRTTTETHGIRFTRRSGMLFIRLPSGRELAYVKPQIGTNDYGTDCITYEGIGSTKKWERLNTYGPKLVENIVQAIARDILCYAMKTLRDCAIVMHIHDELVIEAEQSMSLHEICEQMAQTPTWAKGLQLRAAGYETEFYKKD